MDFLFSRNNGNFERNAPDIYICSILTPPFHLYIFFLIVHLFY